MYYTKKDKLETDYIPNPRTTESILKLGGRDLLICYQCGSCTAICPLAEEYKVSFRKSIKYAQLGLEGKILSDLVPWLCNLHGDCVESCPRNAKPSTILGAIRNYQITRYDWTGISRWWFNSSLISKIVVTVLISLMTLLYTFIYLWPSYQNLINQGIFSITDSTIYFASTVTVIGFFFLITNGYRMYRSIGGGRSYKIGLLSAIKLQFNYWMNVEREALKEPSKRGRILEHTFILMGLGVLSVIILVNAFEFYGIYPLKTILYNLHPGFRLIHKIGLYFAAIGLLLGSFLPIAKRLSNSPKKHWYYEEFSHSTDWASLIFVFSIPLTALLTLLMWDFGYMFTSILGDSKIVLTLTYLMLSIHLSLIVPFLLLEVPFGKHIHWLYRFIANYVATRKGYLGGVSE